MTEKGAEGGQAKKSKIPRQPMPEQEPRERAKNFKEVPLGYTPEQAMLEASRCLQCKKPGCVPSCPVEVDIPSFIALTAEGRFFEAAAKIRETNSLPAVCGRVCPQEDQCEKGCILGSCGHRPLGALRGRLRQGSRDIRDARHGPTDREESGRCRLWPRRAHPRR